MRRWENYVIISFVKVNFKTAGFSNIKNVRNPVDVMNSCAKCLLR